MDHNKRKLNSEDHSLSPDFFKQISSVPVQSLRTENNKVFICSREDNLVDVWKGLSSHHFSSVPVLQKIKKKYYGIVDIHDIMNFILDYFGSESLKSIDNFWKSVEKSDKMKKIAINNVIHHPRSIINPFNPVKIDFSLRYALEMFAKEENLERIPIITKDKDLYGMLTASRVIQYLYENKKIMGNRLKKPIDLLGCSNTGIFSIKESSEAISAFQMMRDKNINCVAVENNEGSLTGVISQSDIKSVSEDGSMFYKLYRDAKSFVQSINPNKSKIEIISIGRDDVLEKVIDLLHTHRLHQIFVINNKKDLKATGIITLRDVIKDLLCH